MILILWLHTAVQKVPSRRRCVCSKTRCGSVPCSLFCRTKQEAGSLPVGICLFSVALFFSWNMAISSSLMQLKRNWHSNSFHTSSGYCACRVHLQQFWLLSRLPAVSGETVLGRLWFERQWQQSLFLKELCKFFECAIFFLFLLLMLSFLALQVVTFLELRLLKRNKVPWSCWLKNSIENHTEISFAALLLEGCLTEQ